MNEPKKNMTLRGTNVYTTFAHFLSGICVLILLSQYLESLMARNYSANLGFSENVSKKFCNIFPPIRRKFGNFSLNGKRPEFR